MQRKSGCGCLVVAVLVAVGALALWQAAPALYGMRQYSRTPPIAVGTLVCPAGGPTLTVFRKPLPRAICYEGSYRVLAVAGHDDGTSFYSLPATAPDDRTRLAVYWYPSNQWVRMRDTALQAAPARECLLDLTARTMVVLRRAGSNRVDAVPCATAAPELHFPRARGTCVWGGIPTPAPKALAREAGIFAGVIAEDYGAAPPSASPVPLEQGRQWHYAGQVVWTEANTGTVRTQQVQWVTEVVESCSGAVAQAAVVRGLPDELAWYEPERRPGCSVLLSAENRVYRMRATNEQEALTLARRLADEPAALPDGSELFLDLPLAVGRQWGAETTRADGWYGWQVEEPARTNAAGAAQFNLAYRTMPDHQVVELVPGVGITRYRYAHHGTPAAADVRLVPAAAPEPGGGGAKGE